MVLSKLSKDAVKILSRKLNCGGTQSFPCLPNTQHTHPQYILTSTRYADTHHNVTDVHQKFTNIHHSPSKTPHKFTNIHHKFTHINHKFTNSHHSNIHHNTSEIHHTNTCIHDTNAYHQPITITTSSHHTVTTPHMAKLNGTSLICKSRRPNHSPQSSYQLWPVVNSVPHLHTAKYLWFEMYGKFLLICRSMRINVMKKLYHELKRSHRNFLCQLRLWQKLVLGKTLHRRPRLGRNVLFGSVFLSPSTLLRKLQGEDDPKPPLLPQLPKEPVHEKKRSLLAQLLLEMYELFRVWLRLLRLTLTFGPILFLYPITYLGPSVAEAWWGVLLAAIEFSGPILVKLGQWASTRHDLFPETCCLQFSRLQRRAQPHDWEYTAYQMRRAFGPNWRKIFIKFDNDGNPVGSGCVAQVYKVWMSTDAIPDEELLGEIVSEMDDDSAKWDEGLEIMGFGSWLSKGSREEEEEAALSEWRNLREARRKQKEEEEQRLSKEWQSATTKGEEESALLAVVETLTQGLLSSESAEATEGAAAGMGNEGRLVENEEPTLTVSEKWQESDIVDSMDKSLPVEEAPPDDLEGLVPVAVKVLHPGVLSAFRRDLKIMEGGAWLLTMLIPQLKWLSLTQCIHEFAEVMGAQINLKKEATNLEKFSENFADIPFVKFPRPLRPYVTRKVLVETFEEGDAMIDILHAPSEEVSLDLKKHLAQIGVDALLKMVFVDNLVHGDLHPGNILVQNNNNDNNNNDNSGNGCNYSGGSGDITRIMMVDVGCDTFVMDVVPNPNPLRLCILDCGIVSRLTEHNLANFKAVFKQVVLGDGVSVANLFLEHSLHQCSDPESFKSDISTLVNNARQTRISLGQIDVGMLLQSVFSVLVQHRVRLESAFSAVVLAIFVLEGLGRALDPDMDILERARPILVTGVL